MLDKAIPSTPPGKTVPLQVAQHVEEATDLEPMETEEADVPSPSHSDGGGDPDDGGHTSTSLVPTYNHVVALLTRVLMNYDRAAGTCTARLHAYLELHDGEDVYEPPPVVGEAPKQHASHVCCLRQMLAASPDFAAQLTAAEELVTSRGHLITFSPKFHPEVRATRRGPSTHAVTTSNV